MGRRHRGQIIVSILNEASDGSNKMKMMYRANLNFVTFRKYFSELSDKGLIIEIENPNGGAIYKTSKEGKMVLKMLQKVDEIISI